MKMGIRQLQKIRPDGASGFCSALHAVQSLD